jgi:hypothetical protein
MHVGFVSTLCLVMLADDHVLRITFRFFIANIVGPILICWTDCNRSFPLCAVKCKLQKVPLSQRKLAAGNEDILTICLF